MFKGRCDCGQVSFEIETVRETVTVCHCSKCRRLSGHQWACTHAEYDQLAFTRDEGLAWYASSEFAKRGFCKSCGANLFYRQNDETGIAIAAGCFDNPTGLKMGKHIFVKDKGDYYLIPDEENQLERY